MLADERLPPPSGDLRVSRRRPEVLCKQLCGWSLIRVMGVVGVGPSSQRTGLESTLDRLSVPYRAHIVLSLRQEGVD